jgi:hypothetical protein
MATNAAVRTASVLICIIPIDSSTNGQLLRGFCQSIVFFFFLVFLIFLIGLSFLDLSDELRISNIEYW